VRILWLEYRCGARAAVVIGRRLQGEPHAVGRAARLQHARVRRNVWSTRSSDTSASVANTTSFPAILKCLFLVQAYRIVMVSIVISQFLSPGRPNPCHRPCDRNFKFDDSCWSACCCIAGETSHLSPRSPLDSLSLSLSLSFCLIVVQVMSVFVESLCPMLQTALWKRGFK
jgi:hypothetical protein